MKKRIITLALAIIMVFETIMPVAGFAKENTPEQNNLVKVGTIDIKSYPQIDAKIAQEANRRKRQELQGRKMEMGAQLFSAPYFPNQDPDDNQKPLIFANVNAIFKTKGLDGGKFDWEGVFGKDSDGNLNKAQIIFEQMDDKTSTRTGVKFFLKVDKDGTYTWSDSEGKPTKLPLYSTDLKPYRYEVLLDEDVSDHVKLLTARFFGTGGGYAFGKPDPDTGEIVGYINLDLTLQQIASTKFTSKWNTGVLEAERPTVEGSYLTGYEAAPEDYGIFKFPSNDTDKTIIRNDKLDPQNPGEYSEYLASELDKTPTVGVADPDPDATDTYTIDRDNSRISYKGKTYKYKVEYDVINGGKLTMTEVIHVTFDANGGKFKNFTTPDTETKIVKEVEYDGTLTDKAENPTKDRETFKGWATEAKGKPLTEEEFKEAIKNIKEAKTFYAIWDNNDITAEELTVHESFKDGTGYVNDFIPTLETLKGQVKIKDGNGVPQALANDDTLQILDDSGNPIADADLKEKLYEKLKEDDATEVSRNVTLKAKVNLKNGTSKEVDIPIKVIKNIYEAKTEEGKPNYVPNDYVKVTVDPTTKAQDPQKYFYYVNPAAKVVIPGKYPVGVDGNTFTKWLIDGTDTEYKLKDKPRHKFENETTIKAQYSKDVIPQEGDTKPEGVPDNFVKVTFVPTDNGTMEGAKIFWVNPEKEVTIPVDNPVGKQYFTFKEWKIGVNAEGDVYTPSTAKKFTEATTITATYTESDNIIPFDPTNLDDPKVVRPEGYVRVTFAADPGLKLTEQKAYYVKKNAGITLGNTELKKPAYKEETGYKFDKWDKKDDLEIVTTDITVTAKAEELKDVIPKTKQDETEKPDGYVTVKFVAGENGKLKDGETEISDKIFFVNPEKYVKLVPPTELAKGNTGFEFGAWDKDATIPTVYKDAVTTITAQFNPINAVIPKIDENTNKPEGYVEVNFIIDQVEGKDPATFVEGQVTTYYVDPNRDVKIQPPATKANTGYEFEKWDQDTATAKKYDKDTTVKGSFTKLDDIIPGKKDDGTPNAKPAGYVTVTFDKGDQGKEITGQTVYYVNPKADPAKTLGDTSIVKPEVKAETGYKFKSWNFADTKQILSDITVIAQYDSIDDVIPKDKPTGGENEKPDGYIEVTFSTETNGKIKNSTETTKVVYVNPNKAVVLTSYAPEVTPNTGYDFADWDTSINKAIQYKDKDVIKAKYNEKGDVIPQENPDGSDKPAGYLTVTFDKGANGELSGKTVYYVKPNKEVTVPAPDVKPNVGYEFNKWDKELTQTFTDKNTI
ncbi:InlB B-repeat-containing protein, partial [uncultured Peptoniphilus sp.]|uniref:InlB B-repeat-containing protein n=1 Tax=uncultured Peptoniphilus sp. TaxID=254354 RepID=UPI0026086D64